MVSPDVVGWLAIFLRTHALLPVVNVLEPLTVEHAAAREAHEARLQVGNGLGKVFTQSMTLVSILWFETYQVYRHFLLALRQDGEPDVLAQFALLGDGFAGEFALIFIGHDELRLIFLPVCALHLNLGLAYRQSLLVYERQGEVFLLGIDAAGVQAHLVDGWLMLTLLALNGSSATDGDAVPAYIINRYSAQNGIMGIVLAHPVFGGDALFLYPHPCRGGIPLVAVVFLVILKVAVLQHFCRESSVGSAADVFEEDTHQLVGDAVGFLWIDAEVGRDFRIFRQVDVVVLDISSEVGIGLRHRLGVEFCLFREGVEPGTDVVEMHCRHLEIAAMEEFSTDGCGVALPEYLVGRSFQRIFLEGTEIVACLYVSLAFGCLEIDVEVAVIHLIGSHILHAFFADDRIILRAPGDEVF